MITDIEVLRCGVDYRKVWRLGTDKASLNGQLVGMDVVATLTELWPVIVAYFIERRLQEDG